MIFLSRFTCASLSFNLYPLIIYHLKYKYMMVVRVIYGSLYDGFFWSHEMTVLESCPIPKWSTWLVDHCVVFFLSLSSLSLITSPHWCHFMTDRHLSFIPWRSFCACLTRSVSLLQRAGLSGALWNCICVLLIVIQFDVFIYIW